MYTQFGKQTHITMIANELGVYMLSVHINHDYIFVRFEKVPKAEFNHLLMTFKQEFPDTVWEWSRLAWRLMLKDAPRLNWFVHRYFGYNAIVYEESASAG
jgi:hypothetical protein